MITANEIKIDMIKSRMSQVAISDLQRILNFIKERVTRDENISGNCFSISKSFLNLKKYEDADFYYLKECLYILGFKLFLDEMEQDDDINYLIILLED